MYTALDTCYSHRRRARPYSDSRLAGSTASSAPLEADTDAYSDGSSDQDLDDDHDDTIGADDSVVVGSLGGEESLRVQAVAWPVQV